MILAGQSRINMLLYRIYLLIMLIDVLKIGTNRVFLNKVDVVHESSRKKHLIMFIINMIYTGYTSMSYTSLYMLYLIIVCVSKVYM